MKHSLYSFYFWLNYFLIIFFLLTDVNKFGFLLHLISFGTVIYAAAKNFNIKTRKPDFQKSNYIREFTILSVLALILQIVFVPLSDIFRMAYLLIMYWAFWSLFRDKQINADAFLYWLIIGGSISLLLTSLGVAPTDDVSHSPVRLIPVADDGWRVNFGPPGSNVHFTAIVSGLGFILTLHAVLAFGINVKRLLMLILMTYFCVFAGSRAVYIAIFSATVVMAYSYLFTGKQRVRRSGFLAISCFMLFVGLLIVYSAQLIAPLLGSSLSDGAISNLTKSDLSDSSAGRIGLWILHLSIFTDNIFGGGGAVLQSLSIGDTLSSGDSLRAKDESYFTYLLAVYGIWSFLIFYLYASVFLHLSRSRDVLKVVLFIFAIISTAASSLFSGAYGMGIWLIVPLLSAKLVKA